MTRSDTPRTNAVAYDTGLRIDGYDDQADKVVPASFARQLERELAIANAAAQDVAKQAIHKQGEDISVPAPAAAPRAKLCVEQEQTEE